MCVLKTLMSRSRFPFEISERHRLALLVYFQNKAILPVCFGFNRGGMVCLLITMKKRNSIRSPRVSI